MTMNRNHTHTGNCQACGREHAIDLLHGDIAKHGYTVDWGSFNGVCPGADHLPAQKNTDFTLHMIGVCLREAVRLDDYAANVEAGTSVPDTVTHYDPETIYRTPWGTERKGKNVEIPYIHGTHAEQKVSCANAINSARHMAQSNRDHSTFLQNSVLPLLGTELISAQQAEVRMAAERASRAARPTKASFKRQLDALSVAFDKARAEIHEVLLANRPSKFDVVGNKAWDGVYWGPMQLSHWRSRHSVEVLALHPIRLASVIADIEQMYAKREALRALQKAAGL